MKIALLIIGLACCMLVNAEGSWWRGESSWRGESYWRGESSWRGESYWRGESSWNRWGSSWNRWGNWYGRRQAISSLESLDCKFVKENSTLVCQDGGLACKVDSSLDDLAIDYKLFGIGYLAENYTELSMYKYRLFPRNESDISYAFEPVRLENGSLVELFLYGSEEYVDFGLRVLDMECFGKLSELIEAEFKEWMARVNQMPIFGSIAEKKRGVGAAEEVSEEKEAQSVEKKLLASADVDSIDCWYVAENSTISCVNGSLVCGVESRLGELAISYEMFGIGYLAANYTKVKEFRYHLFPRNVTELSYEFEPVLLKNGSRVDLYLFQWSDYADYGLRVLDEQCFEKLSHLIDLRFIEWDRSMDTTPILGSISEVATELECQEEMQYARDVDVEDSLDCKYVVENSTLTCFNGSLVCDVEPHLDELAQVYEVFGIGYVAGNYTELGLFKYFLFPRNFSDSEFDMEPVLLKNGSEASLYLYTSDDYVDFGLRVLGKGCFEILSNLIELRARVWQESIAAEVDATLAASKVAGEKSIKELSIVNKENVGRDNEVVAQNVECWYVAENSTISCLNGTVECGVVAHIDELVIPYEIFGIGFLAANYSKVEEFVFPIYPRNVTELGDYDFEPLWLKNGTRADLFLWFSEKYTDFWGFRVVEQKCFEKVAELVSAALNKFTGISPVLGSILVDY